MKSLHMILVLFSIASMFTSFGVYDVDAEHNGNGKSMGCHNGEAKNNPHCYETSPPDPDPSTCEFGPPDCDGDGIPDSEDACPNVYNDHTLDGKYPDHDNDGIPDFRDKDPCPA